jgi:hypothetical protein
MYGAKSMLLHSSCLVKNTHKMYVSEADLARNVNLFAQINLFMV